MKLIMISKDNKVLDAESSVYLRMKDLSEMFEELHIFVIGRKSKVFNTNSSGKLFIYNTVSSISIVSFVKVFFGIFRVGKSIKKEEVWITSQDPFETGLLAFLLSKIFKFKFQLQIHTDFLSPFFAKESFKNRFRVFLAKKILPKADSVRVVSKRIEDSLVNDLDIDRNKIHILPIFIDKENIINSKQTFNLREKFPEFDKIVLIVARLEKEKNIDLAIRAFDMVLKQNPKTGLVIFGEGRLLGSLKRLVSSLGIEGSVKFMGFAKDIYSAYRSSDCLLVTSSYEGYGMNIVEASILGLPIVSTDVGVAREVGFFICLPKEIDVFQKLQEILFLDKEDGSRASILLSKTDYYISFKKTFLC